MAWPANTCHNRHCPISKEVNFCSNLNENLLNLSYEPGSPGLKMFIACCELTCGKHSQILQLQCQGATQTMAVVIWLIVAVLLLCALLQVLTIFLERYSRIVAMVGAPLYLAFISVIVYMFTDLQGFYIEFDSPYYPIVGAMSVATFSYYFSSFQYSITLMHELAAATALVFSMFLVWTLLTMRVNSLVKYETSTADDKGIRRIVVEVILMLLISLLWTLHSSVYRTIGYRAAWITAFNKEKERGWTGDAMRRMWILAGAQGHPTWRTPTGQSFGLYLAVLAWSISITVRHDLRCNDDLVLFHLLLWGSPVLLTLAVLASQLTITLRASSKFRGENHSLLTTEFQLLRETFAQYTNAVIGYRLGRDTWGMEEEHDVHMYGCITCWGFCWLDKVVATVAFCGEILMSALAYPGIVFLGILQRLIGRLIPESDQQPKGVGNRAWFPLHRGYASSEAEKIEAYRTLCENCLVDDSGVHYECSVNKVPQVHKCERMKDEPFKVDDEVRELFNHCRVIMLPLLLDSTGPSRLAYLLDQLVTAMVVKLGRRAARPGQLVRPIFPPDHLNAPEPDMTTLPARTANRDSEMGPLIEMRRWKSSRF